MIRFRSFLSMLQFALIAVVVLVGFGALGKVDNPMAPSSLILGAACVLLTIALMVDAVAALVSAVQLGRGRARMRESQWTAEELAAMPADAPSLEPPRIPSPAMPVMPHIPSPGLVLFVATPPDPVPLPPALAATLELPESLRPARILGTDTAEAGSDFTVEALPRGDYRVLRPFSASERTDPPNPGPANPPTGTLRMTEPDGTPRGDDRAAPSPPTVAERQAMVQAKVRGDRRAYWDGVVENLDPDLSDVDAAQLHARLLASGTDHDAARGAIAHYQREVSTFVPPALPSPTTPEGVSALTVLSDVRVHAAKQVDALAAIATRALEEAEEWRHKVIQGQSLLQAARHATSHSSFDPDLEDSVAERFGTLTEADARRVAIERGWLEPACHGYVWVQA